MLLARLLGQDLGRWWMAARIPAGPLREYYRTDTPTLDTPYDAAEFLAIDIETTGLDRGHDEIVSIGYVPVIGGRIRIEGATRFLVRPNRPVGHEAATVHGLLDNRLAEADPPESVMPRLLSALTGRIPIAHHAQVEREFLSNACRRLYGHPLEVSYVDTLELAHRLFPARGEVAAKGAFRLSECRKRHNLPRLRPHDALSDALAAAELFLAQAAYLSGRKPAALKDLLP